jgi:hypothetical protein
VTELGRIAARLACTYGWTHDYILRELSLGQVMMYHEYALEMDGHIRIQHPEDTEMVENDGPDVDAIERRYGDRIRRV